MKEGGELHIVLSNSSALPIYEQIKEQIKAVILSGELCENDMLPSLRQLAKDLKISVLTTTRASQRLMTAYFCYIFSIIIIISSYYFSVLGYRKRK